MMFSAQYASFAHPRAGGDLGPSWPGLDARDSRLRGNERSIFLEMPKI